MNQSADGQESLAESTGALTVDCTGKLLVGESLLSYKIGARDYRVYTPPGYSPWKLTPVVFSLHGGGGNADQHADGTQLRAAAANNATGRKFIIVEPQGTLTNPAIPDHRYWNGGNSSGPASDLNAPTNHLTPVDDVGFLKAIVGEIKARYCVDPKRVFSTGLSNGGEMSHRLACQAGTTFAAVVSASGGRGDLNLDVTPPAVLYTCPADPVRKAPVLEVHGNADLCWPYLGGIGPLDLFTPTYPSVERSMGAGGWMTRHHCSSTQTPIFDYSDGITHTVCKQYDGCATPGAVATCTVTGGGHVWPGGSGAYSLSGLCGGVKPQTFNNDAILLWLMQHPMP